MKLFINEFLEINNIMIKFLSDEKVNMDLVKKYISRLNEINYTHLNKDIKNSINSLLKTDKDKFNTIYDRYLEDNSDRNIYFKPFTKICGNLLHTVFFDTNSDIIYTGEEDSYPCTISELGLFKYILYLHENSFIDITNFSEEYEVLIKETYEAFAIYQDILEETILKEIYNEWNRKEKIRE